jgi:hypothetical protein
MNGGKHEGFINHTDLLVCLRLRADELHRDLQGAIREARRANDRAEVVLNKPLPEGGKDET